TAAGKKRGRKPGSKNVPVIPPSTAATKHPLHASDFKHQQREVACNFTTSAGGSTTSGMSTVTLASSSSGRHRTASTKLALAIQDDLVSQSGKEQKDARANLRSRKTNGRQ